MSDVRFKVVTRTYWQGSVFDDRGSVRDTRFLTRPELAEWCRINQADANEYGTSGTVNLDGKPYASFARGQYSPIPRCPLCTVRHYSPCVSRPTPAECGTHDYTIRLSVPVFFMGAVYGYTPMSECRDCGFRIIQNADADGI